MTWATWWSSHREAKPVGKCSNRCSNHAARKGWSPGAAGSRSCRSRSTCHRTGGRWGVVPPNSTAVPVAASQAIAA
jgi:hypothetical protein